MERTKATLYLNSRLFLAAKVMAAATGRSESSIVEEALGLYVGQIAEQGRELVNRLMDEVSQAKLTENEAAAALGQPIEATA